ncbi:MAG TPA: serine/threonine-protein kinase [Polyangiaceae bacterium]|jgi:hypothetical protein
MSLVGRTLGGRYRIVSLLGKGGMGAVYEAEQIDLRRRVAIKVLTASAGREEVLRFKQEALAAAGLAHPNIVNVIDFVQSEDEPFLVMELLRGKSLSAVVRAAGKLEPARAVAIMSQVLSALAAAHAARIVHRDVKPENIFVCDSPLAYELVKVLDFGLARPLDDDKRLARTRHGVAMGTPAYMAPEQARGESADVRVDVFSAGVTLYYALAGRRPFEGKTTSELLGAVKKQPPIPLDALCPELDLELVRAVERALSKEPSSRFASAREFLEALTPAWPARGATVDAPPSRAPRSTTTRGGAGNKKRSAIEITPFVTLVPPIASGIATVARFEESGDGAIAVGPAGLARLRDGGWSARELPPGISAALVRGFAFGASGEAVVFTESAAWVRASGAYVPLQVAGLSIRGAFVDHASHVSLAGQIGNEGAVVECTPSGPVVHVIGRGAMHAVTRAAGGDLVACGDRGTLCVIARGAVRAHVAGKSALYAIAPFGEGVVAAGENGALVRATTTASDALAAATELTLAPDDFFAVRTRAKWICALGRSVHLAAEASLDAPASASVDGRAMRDAWLGNGVLRVLLDDASVAESELLSAAP